MGQFSAEISPSPGQFSVEINRVPSRVRMSNIFGLILSSGADFSAFTNQQLSDFRDLSVEVTGRIPWDVTDLSG